MATSEVKHISFSEGVTVVGPTQSSIKYVQHINFNLTGFPSPIESVIDGFKLIEFDDSSNHEVYFDVVIPPSYKTGNQINLKNILYFCASTTGNVFFKAISYLIKKDSTVLGSYLNSHSSTNAENTVNGTSNLLNQSSNIDLTDTNGEVNSIAVGVGDILRVRLFRDNASESTSANSDAKLIKDSCYVDFIE